MQRLEQVFDNVSRTMSPSPMQLSSTPASLMGGKFSNGTLSVDTGVDLARSRSERTAAVEDVIAEVREYVKSIRECCKHQTLITDNVRFSQYYPQQC
jgi:hypothetical protein